MFLYVCHFTWRLLMAQSQRSESGVPRMGRAVRTVRRVRLFALRVPERQACSWCPEFSCHPLPLGKGHTSLTPGVWTKRILLLLLVCKSEPPACASLLVRAPDLKGRCRSFVWALTQILYSNKCLHQEFPKHWKLFCIDSIFWSTFSALNLFENHWLVLTRYWITGTNSAQCVWPLHWNDKNVLVFDSLFARFPLNPLVAC